MRMRDDRRRRRTLRAQIAIGLGVSALLFLFSGILFFRQLIRLSDAVAVMREETDRFALVQGIRYQVVDVLLLAQRYLARENAVLFSQEVEQGVEDMRSSAATLRSRPTTPGSATTSRHARPSTHTGT